MIKEVAIFSHFILMNGQGIYMACPSLMLKKCICTFTRLCVKINRAYSFKGERS